MILRKRNKAVQKDKSIGQLMVDSNPSVVTAASITAQRTRGTSIFSVPGLVIGFCSKCQSDSDSARSPRSPLDYKVFSNLTNPFVRSPRSLSGVESPRKSWDCNRVGLGLLDSLGDASNPPVESKNVLFGSNMRINVPTHKTCLDRTTIGAPASLPKNYGISSGAFPGSPGFQLRPVRPVIVASQPRTESKDMGKIQSCSADIGRTTTPPIPMEEFTCLNPKSNSDEFSEAKAPQSGCPMESPKLNFGNHPGSLPLSFDCVHGFMGSLSASDIENSEDYTRIINRGPNPKTTHIFGDCILESLANELSGSNNDNNNTKKGEVDALEESSWLVKCSDDDPVPSAAENFLSFCYFCKKKLVDGEDIYIYRGEKAFCSCDCRSQEILIDEESDKQPEMSPPDSPSSAAGDEEILLASEVTTE